MHYETVSTLLLNALAKLMEEPLFEPFKLVGGTNLSLRLGHRRSEDIDLFTDAPYGSLDFDVFEKSLARDFPYFDRPDKSEIVGFGRSYYIGLSKEHCIKLDLMYADAPFFEPYETIDGIRMATMNQIVAMKMEAINTGGRKKDWWDLHELLRYYSLEQMLSMHKKWEEWSHDEKTILRALVDFSVVDGQPDPICLKRKDWDDIKLDFIDIVGSFDAK